MTKAALRNVWKVIEWIALFESALAAAFETSSCHFMTFCTRRPLCSHFILKWIWITSLIFRSYLALSSDTTRVHRNACAPKENCRWNCFFGEHSLLPPLQKFSRRWASFVTHYSVCFSLSRSAFITKRPVCVPCILEACVIVFKCIQRMQIILSSNLTSCPLSVISTHLSGIFSSE